MDPFTNPKLVELRQQIIEELRAFPHPAPAGPFALGNWLTANFHPNDLELLYDLEKAVGYERSNSWFCGVLSESGRYTTDGDGNVVPKEAA